MPGIVLKRLGERVRHSVSRLSARSCSHMEPESAYAARGAVLAHLSGSGRSRALWTSTLQALHVARLCLDITGDSRSRRDLERSQCDLDHIKPPPGVREVSCTHHFAATVYYTYLTACGCSLITWSTSAVPHGTIHARDGRTGQSHHFAQIGLHDAVSSTLRI